MRAAVGDVEIEDIRAYAPRIPAAAASPKVKRQPRTDPTDVVMRKSCADGAFSE
ncbi:hypothetical protein CS8_098970 [Cupriavidus sp. 8B]